MRCGGCHGRTGGWVILVAALLTSGLTPPAWGEQPRLLTLDQCIEMAMEHNHARPASSFAVAAAEAQHRQALSGYYPHISLNAGFLRTDEPPNFIFPAGNIQVPNQTVNVPATSFQTPPTAITIPANAFGPGFPPQDVQVPVPSQTVNVPAQSLDLAGGQLPISEQDIQLMDENSGLASVNAKWLLWGGGMRKGMRQQAKAGVDVAREEVRRTDLEIVDSVTRLYHGAVMARQVRQVSQDTLARMEATMNLTETLYKEGAGKVRKTDYLDNRVMVETLRSAVALLEKNEAMAQAALAFTIGLAWTESVNPVDVEIPFEPSHLDLDTLVSQAYAFNPDWNSLEAGIRAADGKLREAKSEYAPKLALRGELYRWWNQYDAGMATDVNKQGWNLGLMLEVPLFRGYLTRNRVKEARARLGKRNEEQILLKEGLGLQVRGIVLGLVAAEKRYQATLDAMNTAIENRDLNTRAYRNDLVETEDVIRAQLLAAFMSAQHYKMRYDHAELLSRLNLVVGTEVFSRLTGAQ